MAELKIATLSGDFTVIGEAEVEDFRGSLYGEALTPGDDGYDGARRIWNAMIDKRPAMIAQLQRHSRRDQLGQLRQEEQSADFGAGRRPQLPRQQRLQRRADDRPFPDDRRARRPGVARRLSGRRAGPSGAPSITRPRPSALPPPAAPMSIPASRASPLAAASAGCPAATA